MTSRTAALPLTGSKKFLIVTNSPAGGVKVKRFVDPCCEKCNHSKETPCKDFIECCARGPILSLIHICGAGSGGAVGPAHGLGGYRKTDDPHGGLTGINRFHPPYEYFQILCLLFLGMVKEALEDHVGQDCAEVLHVRLAFFDHFPDEAVDQQYVACLLYTSTRPAGNSTSGR